MVLNSKKSRFEVIPAYLLIGRGSNTRPYIIMKDKLIITTALDELELEVIKHQIKLLMQKAKAILGHEI